MNSRIIRRITSSIATLLQGANYREKFESLLATYNTEDFIGREGYFNTRGGRCKCRVTGLVAHLKGPDTLRVEYVTKEGEHIPDAVIPRHAFRPSTANKKKHHDTN